MKKSSIVIAILLFTGSVFQASDSKSYKPILLSEIMIPIIITASIAKEYNGSFLDQCGFAHTIFLKPTYYHKVQISNEDSDFKEKLIFALELKSEDRSTWREKMLGVQNDDLWFRSLHDKKNFYKLLARAYSQVKNNTHTNNMSVY